MWPARCTRSLQRASRHKAPVRCIGCTRKGETNHAGKTPRDPQPAPHDLILESRARLTVTGVQKVLHCNADSAAMETGKGTLHLTGAQLNMAALDLETGEAKFTGRIDTLEYTASVPAGGFLRRLLR